MSRRTRLLLGLTMFVVPLGACSVPITAGPCSVDLDCPAGRFCGPTGTCIAECIVDSDCRTTHGPASSCDERGRCTGAPLDGGAVLDAPDAAGIDDGGDVSPDGGMSVSTEEAMLVASGGTAGDRFGNSVALSSDGSRALVGSSNDTTGGGTRAGSSRVFLRSGTTWAEEATLLSSGAAGDDFFGHSVAVTADGTRALVGVFQDDTVGGTDAGSARVFRFAGAAWFEEATLLASDGAADDQFGWSVALTSDGSRALVAANADDTAGGVDAGSAHVFLRTGTTWMEEALLVASATATGDYLGTSVALSADGSRALVGAGSDDTAGGVNAGSARVFVRTGTTWLEEAMLLAFGGASDDRFGWSVALSSDGSRALVGVYQDDTMVGVDAGSVRVFLRTGTTWGEEATLIGSRGAASGDLLGISVALSADGSRGVAGATRHNIVGGSNAGSARVFLRAGTTWLEDVTLLASGGAADDSLGCSVALSSDGTRALVGALADDTAGGIDAGSARVFLLPAP